MSLAAYYEQRYGERPEIERLKAQLTALTTWHEDQHASLVRELDYWRSRAKGITFLIDRGNQAEVFPVFHPMDQERLRTMLEAQKKPTGEPWAPSCTHFPAVFRRLTDGRPLVI